MLKGFLGPIGDDLPSLIPLLFALMIFFYVFTFTWNTFDEGTRAFNDAMAVLRVGNTLKGNNYLSGFEAFEQRCSEAKAIKRVKFMAGLLELSTGPGQPFEGVGLETMESKFYSNGETFLCANTDERPVVANSSLDTRYFPVALEFKNEDTGSFYIRPMLLAVVTWR